MLSYSELPKDMQNKYVYKYYNILNQHKKELKLKKKFDFIVSLVMIIILFPLFVIIGIWIKIDSKGPIFYKQERLTTYGKKFMIYKFRTMKNNADKKGALITGKNDSRITKVGRFIRSKRIDEIPQLINIIKGEMSFVGTRPEVGKYVKAYTPNMMPTLLLPSGVTSIASIKMKNEEELLEKYLEQGIDIDEAYIKYILPEKMKYNLKYLRSYSFINDIRIMIRTLVEV